MEPTGRKFNDLNVARYGSAGAGITNTAALSFAGNVGNAKNELWNGTNWTEVNDLNSGRDECSGSGIQTAALAFGGQTAQALTESWNGTNWTETADLNTGRHSMGVNSAGTNNTSALTQGGTPGVSAATEEFSFVGGIQTIDTD